MENNVKKIIYNVMYNRIEPELDENNEVGGLWTGGSSAGMLYWHLADCYSGRYRYSGSRLFINNKCWKIYNGYGEDEHYNIIVHFNDNDEITNVEWIDDSTFDAFDKEFMYSIYEDLKKYIGKNDDLSENDKPITSTMDHKIKDILTYNEYMFLSNLKSIELFREENIDKVINLLQKIKANNDVEEDISESSVMKNNSNQPYYIIEALCKALDVDGVLDPNKEFKIKNGYVWFRRSSGKWDIYDERPDLYAALRNLICAITPNCEFRSGSDITHYADERDY
ncbi:MAG: hypothetical protein IKU29_03825 [Parabacteroides sp.]|nr:hypothetical protein [Parabacteroides sp.]